MNSEWLTPAKILTGMCLLAASSFSQTYTISAKPGALNFIEGDVTVNGDPVWKSNVKSTFLAQNDVIAVKQGRAEVLLNPGVFLRISDGAQVRMLKPSLIDTQLEVLAGESMLEVDNLEPGSSINVLDHGSSTTLLKPGLYKFTENYIASLEEGKAEVVFGSHKVELKKNKQVEIGDALAETKVDLKAPDDLYAWSNNRAQYNAAATYAGATNVYNAGGYGYSAINSPGWYWNSPFNSYMWLPGNGAYYSPFGWGFYGPGVVAYAPVFTYPLYGSGYYTGAPVSGGGAKPVKSPTTTALTQLVVPVNPKNVGAANVQSNSPAEFARARSQVQQAVSYYGLHTANGAPAASLRSGQTFSSMNEASHAASASARAVSSGGGGFSGGGAAHGGGAGYSGGGAVAASSHSSGAASTGHGK